MRVFGPTATLTARDTTNWIYHGRELAGQYKILNVYSKREGEWKFAPSRPAQSILNPSDDRFTRTPLGV